MSYEGWNFKEKSFLIAIALSILWHLFWFFSVTITVSSEKKFKHNRPKIVSLGPVLDDTIFRTLVQNKPRYTETFYRRLSDFSSPVELAPALMSRYSAGEVVSVPLGRRAWDAMRDLIGGSKSSPEYQLGSEISLEVSGGAEALEGEVRGRQILSKPPDPLFPFGMDAALKFSETTLELTVQADGIVSNVRTAVSSGSPELDAVWSSYLSAWQFSPLSLAGGQDVQTGRAHFRFSELSKG